MDFYYNNGEFLPQVKGEAGVDVGSFDYLSKGEILPVQQSSFIRGVACEVTGKSIVTVALTVEASTEPPETPGGYFKWQQEKPYEWWSVSVSFDGFKVYIVVGEPEVSTGQGREVQVKNHFMTRQKRLDVQVKTTRNPSEKELEALLLSL